MALHAYPRLRLSSSSLPVSSSPHTLFSPSTFNPQPLTFSFPPIGISSLPETRRRRRHTIPVATVVEESQESSEPEAEAKTNSESHVQDQAQAQAQAELASELKKAMQERKEKEGEGFWGGVGQEIREIEWPAFGKVLGTTGVVLGVIFGSSVVLLTVNAVLAELSDRVFAGKGVQDFFS